MTVGGMIAGAVAGAAEASLAKNAKLIVTPDGADPKRFKGLVKPGNLDIYDRKILHNADGSYSTTSSSSFHDERTGLEVLVPTVINGVRYSPQDAWQHYLSTGENLGMFDNPRNADRYATLLHNNQASRIESANDPDRGALGPHGPMTDFNGLAPVFQQQLQSLIAASNGRVRLVSGFRSAEQQQAAFDEAAKRFGPDYATNWFADPAHSNHVKGAAGDLAGDLTVAHQLAPQFGLAFPMSWEPQHVEMASTRLHAHPLAYTDPPPGETNPVHADLSNSAPHVAAQFAEAILGMNNDSGLGTNGGSGMLSSPAQAGATADLLSGVPVANTAAATPASGGTQSGGSTSAGGTSSATPKGNVAPGQLYQALTAAGLSPVAAAAFVSIAGRESGYNTGAHNGNRATGDDSYGLFQINLLNGGWTDFLKAHGIANPAQDLQTLDGSVRAAAAIYGSSGLHPWGGYKGMPWWYSTNLDTGAAASGGAVSVGDMQALGGG